ncbi:MAG: ATP-binding protein [Venatoribacter sp.]
MQHTDLLQRLTLLRLASIGVWGAFLLYLLAQHFVVPTPVWFGLGGYLLLFALGGWRIWRQQAHSWHLLLHLVVETQLLAGLLYFSGGAANPLISYYLVLLVIAAYSLSRRQAIAVTLLAVLNYSLLTRFHIPLQQASGFQHTELLFNLHLIGMWLTFVVSAFILVALIPYMKRNSEKQQQEIQTLREQQLKNEQLIGIASLAAGTAHEMGTPLMTMSLLLNDLQAGEPIDESDLHIMRSQISHCQSSLKALAKAGREAKNNGQQLAADWITSLLHRWRLSHPKAQWQDRGINAYALISASPLLDQALLNLLDNAAEAGDQAIHLHTSIQGHNWRLSILQPDPQAAAKLNQSQPFNSEKEYGLGLGLYLSNASVEQFGGSIHLQAQENGSSLCTLQLPLITEKG